MKLSSKASSRTQIVVVDLMVQNVNAAGKFLLWWEVECVPVFLMCTSNRHVWLAMPTAAIAGVLLLLLLLLLLMTAREKAKRRWLGASF
jgi:cell division protein FtsW (lipid II flippase)